MLGYESVRMDSSEKHSGPVEKPNPAHTKLKLFVQLMINNFVYLATVKVRQKQALLYSLEYGKPDRWSDPQFCRQKISV